MAKHYLLYGHGGSYNHGAEALVQTTIAFLRQISPNCKITLSTHFPEQDKQFSVEADEFVWRNTAGTTNEQIYESTLKCITQDTVCIHIGGDNYCYKNWQRYAMIHDRALKQGAKSILWSCSIDPEEIDDEMLNALSTHHLIASREIITYKALKSLGLSNVVKVSDIAFTLQKQPTTFEMQNYVTINLSPLVARKNPIVQKAVEELVDYILSKTDFDIALVPHVLAKVDNDYDILNELFSKVDQPQRVKLVSDKLSAGQYKTIISGARFGMFARTHACIAAYSSLVPTIALGYSSKAFGIATDLGMSDYVLDVGTISDKKYLIQVFANLIADERKIKRSLSDQMPVYIKNAIPDYIVSFMK